jgi:hypothetical protein
MMTHGEGLPTHLCLICFLQPYMIMYIIEIVLCGLLMLRVDYSVIE